MPPELEKDKDCSEASSTPRLKFIQAQLMDGGCEDDAGDVGSIANALAISMACESARIENAVTVSEMDLAITNLMQWRQKLHEQQQAFIDADEGGSAGGELTPSLCPETEMESDGDLGVDDCSEESSIDILRRLRRELNAAAAGGDSQSPQPSSADRVAARLAALSTAVGGPRGSGSEAGDYGPVGASKTEKVDLSRLTQQSAFLDSPSRLRALDAHAGAGAGVGAGSGAGAGSGSRPSTFPSTSPSHHPTPARLSEADSKEFHNPDTASNNSHPTAADTDPAPANNTSPENRRLNMLISSTQSSALLSAAHTSRQSAVASDGESLEGHMEALQDELRELESDFDAVLARLR